MKNSVQSYNKIKGRSNAALTKVASFAVFLAQRIGSAFRLIDNPIFRTIRFISARNNKLMIGGGGEHEVFVVSTSDKAIGLSVYANQRPYDFEKFEQAFRLLDKNRKNRQLIEVGANIGTICIPAIRRGFFETAIVFEPEPLNFSLLNGNIHLNRLSSRITPHQLALGSVANQKLSFELSADNSGDHRVHFKSEQGAFNEEKRKIIEVVSTRFDSIFDNIIADETLVWIDTQGFEGHVLDGARNAIKTRVPLCLEFGPIGWRAATVLKCCGKFF